MTTQLTAGNIKNNTIQIINLVQGIVPPKITSIAICDSSYNVLDDVAANTTGGYIQITGSNFNSNSTVIVGTNNAVSTTLVNSTVLRAQIGSYSASSYPVYVIDSYSGATAIKINGLTTSSFPAWSTGATLSNQSSNTFFSVNLSATSDSNITYSNTTSLPAGTTLLANGLFYGTVSIGAQTTYTFNVDAKDVENQDALRTFSLTITVNPSPGLYAWGYNNYGGLGLNNKVSRSSPTQVGAATNWSEISMGYTNLAAVKTDGTLWTWGGGYITGLNDTVYRSSPAQVGALTNWSKVYAAKSTHTFAIKTDGTLWAWGTGANGQMGQNDRISRSSPIQIGAATDWSTVGAGSSTIFGIRSGTLWIWGYVDMGVSGLNNNIQRSSPTQIGSLSNWSLIESSGYTCAAIKSDGTLWAWGHNGYGQLGQNDTIYRSSPVQIGAGTTWSKAVIKGNGSQGGILAIKSDGTLWAWGYNLVGDLPFNDRVYRSSPTQVGALTNWSFATGGGNSCMAIKTDGTLWGWGRNNYGTIGLNNTSTSYISSPVQIGAGASWSKVSVSTTSDVLAKAT